MAKVCSSTNTMAPMNGPIGWFMPPSTAMIRMLISQLVPTEPGPIRPLYQTSSTPPIAASTPGHRVRRDAVRGHVESERIHAPGLSRMPCSAMPNGDRSRYFTKK
jgi:hypothetical protein